MSQEPLTGEIENRRERQELFKRLTRFEHMNATYREMADARESAQIPPVIVRGARVFAPRGRIGIIERGAVILAEDHLGPCDMAPNPEWRVVANGEGHTSDLVAPLYDGQGRFICGVMGASRGILYIDSIEEIDDSLRADFATYVRFAGVAISAVNAAERDRRASVTCPLTGLPNRRALERIIGRMVAEGRKFAYVIIDLDNFKQINDTQGHGAGDTILKHVGEVLSKHTRANDFPARLAGDEFVVLLASGDVAAGAARVSDWLGKNGVKASTGVALYPENGKTPEELYHAADLAMYQNKKERRAAGLR